MTLTPASTLLMRPEALARIKAERDAEAKRRDAEKREARRLARVKAQAENPHLTTTVVRPEDADLLATLFPQDDGK